MEKNYFILKNNALLSLMQSKLIYFDKVKVLFFIFLFFVSFADTYAQSCNVVNNGSFVGNASGWSLQGTASTGWHYVGGEAYIEVDGASNVSLSQSLTGLIGNSLTVSFKIKGQNAGRSSVCPTTATLVVRIGGTPYMTITNPGNNSQIFANPTYISTSNGASYTTTGFPLTVAGSTSAAITQGTITLTIPWNAITAAATTRNLEFVATTSLTLQSNGCAAWGGDDWYLDDISVVAANPTVYNVTGTNICFSNAGTTSITLSGSQLGVNYQLVRNGNTNVGSVIAGNGARFSFPAQNVTGVYTVVATAGATSCTTNMNGSVTIYAQPTTANAGTDQTLCNSTPSYGFTLSGNQPTVGTGMWTSPDSSVAFANASAYNSTADVALGVTGRAVWTITNGICTSSDEVIIKREAALTANAGVDNCAAPNVNFTVAGGTPSGGTWILTPGGGSSTGVNISAAGNVTGFGNNKIGIFRYTVTNSCGSTFDDVIYATGSVGTPTAITISSGTQPTCQLTNGTTTTAYATTATNSTGFNWSLSNSLAGTINPTTGVMTWANGFFGTVDIRVTANGCSGASVQTIRTVTVSQTIAASVSISASATSICAGTSVTFTATPTNGGTNPTYQWKLNGANVGTNSPTYTNATLANGNTVTCVMTSNATPCLTGSPATSNPITMTVSTALTAASISPNAAQNFCPSGTGNLLTASGTGGGVLTYQWGYRTATNGAITPIAGKTASTYTPAFADLASGTKYIVCTVTPGCGAARITNEVTVTITGPAVTGVTICAGGSGSLTSSASCGSSTTVGANNAGTAATSGGSGTAWTNTSRIVSDNNSYVSADINSSSENLLAADYGFSIPSGVTITGVEVTIGRYGEDSSSLTDNNVQLLIDGVATGTNKKLAGAWPNSKTVVTYGSTSDLWGATLTPAIINASNFGVLLDVNNSNGSNRNAYVDYIQIKVTYATSLDWFTVLTGGTKIGSGTTFNPVGAANSPLDDTNTPGTTTFWAECSSNPGCRTPVNYVINAKPAAPTATALVQPNCSVLTGSVTLSGLPIGDWTIKQTGSVEATYNNTVANTTSYTIQDLTAGTYSFTVAAAGSCPSEALLNVVINNPPIIATWNGTDWSSTPTTSKRVEFLSSYSSGSNVKSIPNVDACSCYVKNNAKVVFNSGHTLNVINEVVVNEGTGITAALTFENNASLVQHNEDPNINSGNIIYKRVTLPVNRYDYTYWSSPVTNMTLGKLSPTTFFDKYFSYNNAWKPETRATAMNKGIGYSIRAPQTTAISGAPQAFPATFTGVPHNGVVTLSGLAGSQAHLLGNPYPSAIDADVFLDLNSDLNVAEELRVLEGTLYFWTHNTPPSTAIPGDKKYNYTANDYATYNRTGGVGTGYPAKVDPLNYATGTNFSVPTGNIAAGQGFFAPTKAGGIVVFNNTMRISGGTSGTDNAQFFKLSTNSKTTIAKTEKNRIWLNLTNNEGAFKQTLVGYITGATNDYDGAFDGVTYDGNQYVDFYSVNNEVNLSIQGRALPFVKKDSVALGYKSTIKGDFQISIDHTDGALSSQNVFLEDKVLKVQHDLKKEAYTFATEIGTFNSRFVLRYVDKNAIEIIEPEIPEDSNTAVLVSVQNGEITVNSTIGLIDKVIVYDVAGRKRYQNMKVTNNSLIIKNILSSHQVLVVKITLENGKTVTSKIVY